MGTNIIKVAEKFEKITILWDPDFIREAQSRKTISFLFFLKLFFVIKHRLGHGGSIASNISCKNVVREIQYISPSV